MTDTDKAQELVKLLCSPLTRSMFLTSTDVYREQEAQRKEAAKTIEVLSSKLQRVLSDIKRYDEWYSID